MDAGEAWDIEFTRRMRYPKRPGDHGDVDDRRNDAGPAS
jgi:hypothetical protein